MAKSESKALIEAYAKQTGKPTEEVAAEIAALFGYQKTGIPLPSTDEKMSPIMKAILEAQKIEREMGNAGKGEVSPVVKMMMETVTMMPLMKMMGSMGQEGTSLNDMLAKNDEKWERRNAQEKSDRRFEELQKTNERLERLFLEGGAKKDDPIFVELKEQRKELVEERKERHKDALAAKDDKITALKDYIDDSLAAIQDQPVTKSAEDGYFEMMDKMSRFDEMVRRRGKTLGMTDEQIEKEVTDAKGMKSQIIKDIFKTINRGIDAWSGKEAKDEEPEEPEVAEETAAEKAARKKGEIPVEAEQPTPTTPEEVLNIS